MSGMRIFFCDSDRNLAAGGHSGTLFMGCPVFSLSELDRMVINLSGYLVINLSGNKFIFKVSLNQLDKIIFFYKTKVVCTVYLYLCVKYELIWT
jgi:hypothetical protein